MASALTAALPESPVPATHPAQVRIGGGGAGIFHVFENRGGSLSNQAEVFQRGVGPAHRAHWVFTRFVFADIPLRAAAGFAPFENSGPIDFVLADDRLRPAAVGFDVNAARAAGEFFQF